jgi:flagellar motor switch protein FliM
MNPTEMIALVTFQARVGEVEGLMNLCIPHMVVEPVMSKLSTKIWFSMIEKGTSEQTKKSLQLKVEETRVPLIAILGRTELMVSEFLQLQTGDVLALKTPVDGEMEVMVGDLLKFNAKPGVKNKKTAVKITRVLGREDE